MIDCPAMKRAIAILVACPIVLLAPHDVAAQRSSSAIAWGEITGTVYGAAVHCRVDEKLQENFLDAASAKIALNALSQDDRRAAAREFIRFKRLNQREPERGCLDLRQDFQELVRKLKTTSYGWEWRAIADSKLKRRQWKP